MLVRYLLLLGTLLPALTSACDCTNEHIPLEEAICRADTTGTIVLTVTLLHHLDGNAAQLRIDEVLVGQTDQRTLTVGSQSSCAWYIGDEPLGQRYLYLYSPIAYGDYEGDLFGCSYIANIYRLNQDGTEVEYGHPNRGNQNVGLRYRPFCSLIANRSCAPGESAAAASNPLGKLQLAGSLGTGSHLSLSLPGGELPTLEVLRCYRADGRLLAEINLRGYVAGTAIDLSRLPRGYNILVITDGVWRKTLPFIKSD